MTRNEVIEKLVAEVDDWDLDTLLGQVKGDVEDWANDLTNEQLLECYNDRCSDGDRISAISEEKKCESG